MSPSSLSGNPRAVRPWLAAALMMTVWLAATPARCDPGPDPDSDRGAGAVRLAASALAATTLAGPAWHWLQQAWAELRAWSSGGTREWQGSRPATRLTAGGWQDLGNAGSSTPDDGGGGGSAGTGSGSGGTGSGGSDPNGG